MANNKRNIESKKYQKALTLEDRINLSNLITTNRKSDGSMSITLNMIAEILEKDPTTLSKEVKNRRSSINLSIPNFLYVTQCCYYCAKQSYCSLRKESYGLLAPCSDFERYICPHLKHFPWVCNGCKKRSFCNNSKSYYKPSSAEDAYQYTLVDSRVGIHMTASEFKAIDDVVSSGLKKKQSIEHILHSNNVPISVKTAYTYLRKGYFSTNLLDTHRMVRLMRNSNEKPHNSKILRAEKMGRNYEDFQKLLEENPGLNYFEMDTIEGKKGGKVVLSLHLVHIQFQFYFLLDCCSANSVVDKLNQILDCVGFDNYKKIFFYGLTDNGKEFTDINGMIYKKDTNEVKTNIYFCHPRCSGEKGSCERNHELFRYIIPKGRSMNDLTQEDMNKITSHINSYKRKSTDFSTPIELFYAHYGHEILDLLGISLIQPNDVILSPDLIYNK